MLLSNIRYTMSYRINLKKIFSHEKCQNRLMVQFETKKIYFFVRVFHSSCLKNWFPTILDVLRRFFFHGNFVYKMHYVEFPWILPTKKFVEEVIMQIALIGCENSEACCETVTWLIEGAWWEGALGLRPQAWADAPLGNLPTQLRFVRKKPQISITGL